MFCGRLLEKLNDSEGGFPVSPLVGSIIIGLTSFLSTCVAFCFIKMLGRKTLLALGQLGCAAMLTVAGFCLYYGQNLVAFIAICVFIFSY